MLAVTKEDRKNSSYIIPITKVTVIIRNFITLNWERVEFVARGDDVITVVEVIKIIIAKKKNNHKQLAGPRNPKVAGFK